MFSDWFDRPSSRSLLWKLLLGGCALTLIAQLVYYFASDHSEGSGKSFAVQDFMFFYGILGFLSCVASIFVAKAVGYVLKRPENYYGDSETENLPDVDKSGD